MRQSMSFRLQCVFAVAVIAAGAIVWFAREPVTAAFSELFSASEQKAARSNSRRGRNDGAVPVVIQEVGFGRNDVAFAGIGTARAVRHVTLFPAVSAEILKVHTRAGQRVQANDKLFELDDRQAQLAVDMAASKLNAANLLLGRADRLLQRRVQSEARVQDAEAVAAQAEVELKAAKVSVNDHIITAPFAGVVGIAGVEVGDRVTPATALLSIDDRSTLSVEFDVPEQYLPRLSRGIKVDVRTPGFSDRAFEGTLSSIDSRVHPTRRTVAVRAEVANSEDLLRPGMSFAVDLNLPGAEFPSIPDLALQFSQSGNYVWLAKDGKAERVTVKTVRRNSNTVLVEGALRPGDKIIIEGVQRLSQDRAIYIADNESPNRDRPETKSGLKIN